MHTAPSGRSSVGIADGGSHQEYPPGIPMHTAPSGRSNVEIPDGSSHQEYPSLPYNFRLLFNGPIFVRYYSRLGRIPLQDLRGSLVQDFL